VPAFLNDPALQMIPYEPVSALARGIQRQPPHYRRVADFPRV
jgi:hypothetical protein